MSFKTADQVWSVIDNIRQAGVIRSRNRARINAVFNGDPPYTDKEARENNIETNVNFLEGTRIILQARQQAVDALMKQPSYFSVSLDAGPVFKRSGWGSIITKELNRILKRSSRYLSVLENQLGSAVLHGPGPASWLRRKDWCPVARGVDDMMIPSNTLQSLENLDHFGIRITFTAAELLRVITAESIDKGWNVPLIKQVVPMLLKRQVTANNSESYYDWTNFEKLQEDWKQQSGFWGSDAIPVLRCFDFYYLETDPESEEKPTWRRKIIVDREQTGFNEFGDVAKTEWLYDGKDKDYGTKIEHILHVQFADGAVVPPYKWHSVRSLGYLLYAVCHLMNRVRCKHSDAVFESMLWYFRNVAEGDKERVEMINLKHLGIIPQGLDFVPQGDRHTIDPALIQQFMQANRQLMSDSAASYVQDLEQRGGTPPTATQIIAQVNQANALIGSMLTRMYTLQTPGYREVARRFASFDHPDCKKFRERCESQGVPPEIFTDFDSWNVEPDRVMGSGNKMLAIAQADRLLQIQPQLKPAARDEVTRMFVQSTVEDPAVAERLVPRDTSEPTPGQEKATLAWATLMMGKQVILAPNVNTVEYIGTLALMLEQQLQQIEQSGQVPQLTIVAGLANVLATIAAGVQEIAGDPSEQQVVKELTDILKPAQAMIEKFMAAIKQQQAAQSEQSGQPQMDPEAMAKIQAILLTAKTKADISEKNAEQKRQQKEIAFLQEQQRKQQSLAGELATGDLRTRADIARQNITAANEPRTEP